MDEQLVLLVQQYPAIYDLGHKDYGNILVRDNIWREIAETLHKTTEECKSKWTLLRSYFVRARSRRKTTTGQTTKKIKKWRLEDQMQFLIPFLQERDSQSNFEFLPVKEEPEDEATEVEPSLSPPPSPSPSSVSCFSVKSSRAAQRNRGSPGNPKANLEVTMSNLISSKNANEPPEPKKTLMTFFEDIAESMLKFSELERAEIKHQIFNLVNRKEIEILRQRHGRHFGPDSVKPAAYPKLECPCTSSNSNS